MTSRRKPNYLTGRLQGAWVVLLVLALLWAQTLGLAHRVWHAPELSQAQPLKSTVSSATLKAGVLDHFLSGSQGDPSCQILDQLGLGESLAASQFTALPAVLPAILRLAWVSLAGQTQITTFEARGPPGF